MMVDEAAAAVEEPAEAVAAVPLPFVEPLAGGDNQRTGGFGEFMGDAEDVG